MATTRQLQAAPATPRVSINVEDTQQGTDSRVKAAVEKLNFYYGANQRAEEP